MRRRKYIAAVGSLAAGGAALMGTGATTTFSLNDRTVGANVVADSNGAVRLADRTTENSIVEEVNGELEIDFGNGNGRGVNVGSVVDVGDISNPSDGTGSNPDPAFAIENQATAPMDLEVLFEAGGSYSANTDGSTMTFAIAFDGRAPPATVTVGDGLAPGDTKVLYDQDNFSPPELKPGQRAFAALRIDADNSNSGTGENLSGDLEITATQPPSDA